MHEYLYWEFHEQGGKQALRYGKWKGVRLGVHKNPDAPLKLYNLTTDIEERNNLANDYPEIVEKIIGIMEEEHTYSGLFSFEHEKDAQKDDHYN